MPLGGRHHDAAHRQGLQNDAADGLRDGLHLRDGIFHRLVPGQSLRFMGVRPSAFRAPILVWRLDNDSGQRVAAPALLVQKSPAKPEAHLPHRRADQHRHVVRTLRHHRRLALPGFSAGKLGCLSSDVGGHRHLRGHAGGVFHHVPFVCAILPVIAVSEVKGATPQANPHHPLGGAKGGH